MGMGPLPRIHPREAIVRKAEGELKDVLLDAVKKHDLTEGEALRVACAVFADWVASTAKYMIREERHPGDPNTPGGLE